MDLEKKVYQRMREIALVAHKGQFRNDGVTPYIAHPDELADQFTNYIDKAIGVGHDVLEDGKANGVDEGYIQNQFEALSSSLELEADFDWCQYAMIVGRVMGAIQNLSHFPPNTYFAYIDNIKPENIKFKVLDITLNVTDQPSQRQVIKYKSAMKILANTL